MTDEKAISLEITEEEDSEETESYVGNKKAEINIDVIGRNFEAGDRVSINTLKEKKMIPSNVGYVKILARGSLDKPLTVVAQKYSVAAVKMILLTGGTVIVNDGSSHFSQNK